jgi:hypothetical protein
MTDAAWVALGGVMFSAVIGIITATLGIKRFSESVKKDLDEDIKDIKKCIADSELSIERRMGEMGLALREKTTQVEFHIRDNYVHNDVFNRVIEMAAANNENQFRVLTESLNRIHDRLDAIQLAQRQQT